MRTRRGRSPRRRPCVSALGGRRSRRSRALAGAAFVAASVLTRFGVFEAGLASARDPKYVVVPQRERLRQREARATARLRRGDRRPTSTPPPAHPVRRRRRLRLQGAARRARAGARRLPGGSGADDLLVGLENGDDAAVVRIDGDRAVVLTTDFFTPVVDDPYDWGRIAAANALSDVYAMGGEPLVAVNLLAWPRDRLPFELAAEVLRGGAEVCAEAGCHLAGGHSIDDPEPKYGLAVTGLADPDRLLRNDAGVAGTPADPDQAARARRPQQPAQGHRRGLPRGGRGDDHAQPRRLAGRARRRRTSARPTSPASGCSATCSSCAGPAGSRRSSTPRRCPTSRPPGPSLAAGFVPGGSRRNLDWVRPHVVARVSDDELLLLADAQTSGGLLVAGELPGHPVVGELVRRRDAAIVVR